MFGGSSHFIDGKVETQRAREVGAGRWAGLEGVGSDLDVLGAVRDSAPLPLSLTLSPSLPATQVLSWGSQGPTAQ